LRYSGDLLPLGAVQELVTDSRTGLFYRPGDFVDLAAKLDWTWTHTQEVEAMDRAARAVYEAKHTAAEDNSMLMSAYEFALDGHLYGRPTFEIQADGLDLRMRG
jgi:glycosyltransferase involved in cell wall biosynthesis